MQPQAKAARSSSIGRALQLLGDRWTLLILRDAFLHGHRRFHQWRDALGIPESVLASRLRDLVEAGVLEREDGREYRLSESGLELWRVLVAIWAWESRWVADKADILPALIHLDCGSPTDPRLACTACGESAGARDVSARLGAAGDLYLAGPPRFRRRSSKAREPSDPRLLFPETMTILGDRWSGVVLALALLGTRRFVDFEQAAGLSPTLLSHRLRSLVSVGVLERVPACSNGTRMEYRLTPKGLDFFAVATLIQSWAERWIAGDGGPRLELTHRRCEQRFEPTLICNRCERELGRRSVRFELGTSMAGRSFR